MEIAEFLLARIAEDEAVARAAGVSPDPEQWALWVLDDDYRHDTVCVSASRVLAECQGKRRLVELHRPIEVYDWNPHGHCAECSDSGWEAAIDGASPVGHPCPTMRLVALPYADHPDYDPEWKV